MIHAVCEFCGKDCGRTAILLSLTPFHIARYRTDKEPHGGAEETKSYVICYECRSEHNLPNPYAIDTGVEELAYKKCFNDYLKEGVQI